MITTTDDTQECHSILKELESTWILIKRKQRPTSIFEEITTNCNPNDDDDDSDGERLHGIAD